MLHAPLVLGNLHSHIPCDWELERAEALQDSSPHSPGKAWSPVPLAAQGCWLKNHRMSLTLVTVTEALGLGVAETLVGLRVKRSQSTKPGE